ncbi:hypothetical protein MUP77_04095 [Candidatus Bathyarchaeota archaeon]|nr:hypothetical protein [Candidatus Bathyarchaeota archaeon]
MVQIHKRDLSASSNIEKLMFLIDESVRHPEERDWTKAAVPYQPTNQKVVGFPKDVGIYAIVRLFRSHEKLHPRILYVGISHTQGLKGRLSNHFRNLRSNPDFYDGSRFVNAIWEIVQDEDVVYRILNNDDTRIAVVPIPNASKGYLESLERLAVNTLQPLLKVER